MTKIYYYVGFASASGFAQLKLITTNTKDNKLVHWPLSTMKHLFSIVPWHAHRAHIIIQNTNMTKSKTINPTRIFICWISYQFSMFSDVYGFLFELRFPTFVWHAYWIYYRIMRHGFFSVSSSPNDHPVSISNNNEIIKILCAHDRVNRYPFQSFPSLGVRIYMLYLERFNIYLSICSVCVLMLSDQPMSEHYNQMNCLNLFASG